ncbi:MAG TPA: endonuclease/exonuclease/phosphatase family protein [Pseudaminobacter sp.]|nr:endonuclease/exonuclease/phosphatase family protein [Pseudaminobacter sp.]
MDLFKTLVAAIVAVVAVFQPAHADRLRIAAWNIANLASQPEQALRGHARSPEVYDQIRTVIASLDADIIALQEIGSIPGAERVLGPNYEVHFETRCLTNDQKCRFDNDDIYTAIAVRKSIKDKVTIDQINELALYHDDECCTPSRQVRGSPVAIVEFGGQKIWIPSIHLKSACKRGTTSEDDVKDDCELNAQQFDVLEDWIAARPEGDAVILAGDFNRLLFAAPELVARLGTGASLLPSGDSRSCWQRYRFDFNALKAEARANNPKTFEGGLTPQIYTPKEFGFIDFFVISGLTGSKVTDANQVETDAFDKFSNPGDTLTTCDGSPKPFGAQLLTFGTADPSDHCPILVTLTL